MASFVRALVALLSFALAIMAGAANSQEFRRISDLLIAPCCWRESVRMHRSPEAEAMRADIVKRLESGATEEQIVSAYLDKYGERILRVPAGGKAWALYLLPALVLIGGLTTLCVYLMKTHRVRSSET